MNRCWCRLVDTPTELGHRDGDFLMAYLDGYTSTLHRLQAEFGQHDGGADHALVIRVDELLCTMWYYGKLDIVCLGV